jgi:hypothetical protein
MWAASASRFYETLSGAFTIEHYWVDNCWPMDKEKSHMANVETCKQYDIKVLSPGKNLGLHDGFNWALQQIHPEPQDIIIGYDCDCFPETDGWDQALVTTLIKGVQIGWASLMFWANEKELKERGYFETTVDGLKMWIAQCPCINSICAWPYSFLKAIGGLHEPTKFYGGLECAMWNDLQTNNLRWAFLCDYREGHAPIIAPKEYTAYKWAHAHDGTWTGDFESWLARENKT